MRAEQDTVLGGRYRLTSAIAVGGMGEVWQALDQLLDRVVAVKLLKPELASDPGFLDRFRTEARNAAGLSHPSIATVYDYGELDGSAWLVMELVPGEPLSDLLAREGALDARRAAALVAATASGLAAAHRAGLVHRDVKPGNLLVAPDGHVKITDFGIARAAASAPVTATGEVMGTAAYFAPEQAMGRRDLGPTADLYALGVVLYEALAGFRPFTGDSQVAIALAQVNDAPPPLPARVDPVAAALAMALLEKDPLQRPQHAEDVAAVAQAIAAGDDDAAERRLAAASPGGGATARGGAAVLGGAAGLAAGGLGATAASAATPPPTSVMPGATGVQGAGAQRTAAHAAYGVTPDTGGAPWADPSPITGGTSPFGADPQGAVQQMSGTGVSSRPRSRLTVPLIGLIAVLVVIVAAFFAGLLPTGGDDVTPTDTTTSAPATTPAPETSSQTAEETSPTTDEPSAEPTPSEEESSPTSEATSASPSSSATPTTSATTPSTSPSTSASAPASSTPPTTEPSASEEATTPGSAAATTAPPAATTAAPATAPAGASAAGPTAAGATVVGGTAHPAAPARAPLSTPDSTDGDGTR